MKILLSLSGGIDSSALYSYLLSLGHEVFPYFFKYPSKHNDMEREAARRVACHFSQTEGGHELTEIDTTPLFTKVKSNLLVDGGDIPTQPYDKASMKLTVVPGRNLIFASILAAHAQSFGDQKALVALGMHAGDHDLYPDCRPEFAQFLDQTVEISSEGSVSVVAPFIQFQKSDIVRIGLDLNTPFELTRSCYNGTERPCGVCGTCRERIAAFEKNGVKDPIMEGF